MHGSPVFQVVTLFRQSGINQIGESKHGAKQLARESGAKTWEEIGGKIGIYSYATADAYREVWLQLLRFAKVNFRISDIQLLNSKHVGAFLRQKIMDGVAYSTLAQYASACAKLEQALSLYAANNGRSRQYSFSDEVAACRAEASDSLERFEASRAYDDAPALCAVLPSNIFQVAAKSQLEGGPRIHEVSLIQYEQLREFAPDPVTGRRRGWFQVSGKGGKVVLVGVEPDTYLQILAEIRNNGQFQFDKNGYRRALERAAMLTNQEYTGSHGLRWNYVQERMNICQRHGLGFEESLLRVSQEIGHERASITLHYTG